VYRRWFQKAPVLVFLTFRQTWFSTRNEGAIPEQLSLRRLEKRDAVTQVEQEKTNSSLRPAAFLFREIALGLLLIMGGAQSALYMM